MNVPIPLPLARRLLADLRDLRDDALDVEGKRSGIDDRLERLIARANRALVPGRWNGGSDGIYSTRQWPAGTHQCWAACTVDDGGCAPGWECRAPNGRLIATGPETGAEGRAKADAALRRYARRQGWRP